LVLGAGYEFKVCGVPTQPPLCSNSVRMQAPSLPLPKPPTKIAGWRTVNNQVEISFSSGDDNVSQWFEVEQMGHGVGKNGPPPTVWTFVAPRIQFGSRGLVIDRNDRPRNPLAFTTTVRPYTYRVCAGNSTGRTCSGPVVSKASRIVPGPPR
jgi:hypothetical protein